MNNSTTTVVMRPGWSCPDRSTTSVLGLIVLPLLAATINIVMIVAAYLHRSKLKRKNIYIYLYSTLAANVIFSLFAVYQLLNHHLQFEGDPTMSAEGYATKRWWSFRKSYTAALFLVMIGNIGVLIGAIQDGSLLVAKTTAASATPLGRAGHNRNKLIDSLRRQRKKAYILVTAVWFFPTVLALAATGGWSCASHCRCLSGCYSVEQLGYDRVCSRIWIPMQASYMGTIAVFWLIEFILLFTLIFRLFNSSLYFDKQKSGDKTSSSVVVVAAPTTHLQVKASEPTLSSNTQRAATDDENISTLPGGDVTGTSDSAAGAADGAKYKKKKRRRQKRAQIMWLRNAAKQLFILTITFLLCTVPVIIGIVIDIFQEKPLDSTISSVLTALPLLYGIVSPFLLMKHLGGLRTAFTDLVIRLTTQTTTTTHTRRKGATVNKRASNSPTPNSFQQQQQQAQHSDNSIDRL